MPTPTQIVLAWTVDVTNTPLGPAAAATRLGAVPLYVDPVTDPVLGQNFGLTVASDATSTGATTATRTLTLNMDAAHALTAPPPFPCRPRTSTPPTLPYPLREAVTLPGSFFPSNGSTSVLTSVSQIPSLSVNDFVQFLSQQGVFYKVTVVGATSITLLTQYTGVTKNTGAFKEVPAPVTIAAIYSSSNLDTNGIATVPAIPAGAGARTVAITYTDSTGATVRAATAALTGKRPAALTFSSGNGIISAIENIKIATVGGFGNSIGEITLVELSSALPPIPPDRTFAELTDEAQLLISRHLAYLPPSYFALAQQGAATPQLAGDFIVSTGSTRVATTVDQTVGSALAAGNTLEFAAQPGVVYTIASVATSGTGGVVTLTTPYTGLNNNNTGIDHDVGTKGNISPVVSDKPTGASRISPTPAAPPSNAQLAGVLGQFVALETAGPPPNPPLDPMTVPVPTFLSGLFTKTLQLALAGVPVVPQPITFL